MTTIIDMDNESSTEQDAHFFFGKELECFLIGTHNLNFRTHSLYVVVTAFFFDNAKTNTKLLLVLHMTSTTAQRLSSILHPKEESSPRTQLLNVLNFPGV